MELIDSKEYLIFILNFMVAQLVKNLPVMQETPVRFLGWEDPLEEGMATYSSVLAWRIPMDRGVWWATVLGSQRLRHDCVTKHSSAHGTYTHILCCYL